MVTALGAAAQVGSAAPRRSRLRKSRFSTRSKVTTDGADSAAGLVVDRGVNRQHRQRHLVHDLRFHPRRRHDPAQLDRLRSDAVHPRRREPGRRRHDQDARPGRRGQHPRRSRHRRGVDQHRLHHRRHRHDRRRRRQSDVREFRHRQCQRRALDHQYRQRGRQQRPDGGDRRRHVGDRRRRQQCRCDQGRRLPGRP